MRNLNQPLNPRNAFLARNSTEKHQISCFPAASRIWRPAAGPIWTMSYSDFGGVVRTAFRAVLATMLTASPVSGLT